MRIEMMEIGPTVAQEMLVRNEHNRPLKQRKIAEMVKEMLAGTWTQNTDMIGFDINGVLVNGQNRLTAIKESGVTLTLVVALDLPVDAFVNIDGGSSRTAADVVNIAGHSNSTFAAGAAKMLLSYDPDSRALSFTHGKAAGWTRAEILEFVEKHPSLADAVQAARRLYDRVGGSTTGYAVALYLISDVNGIGLMNHYVDKLVTQFNEPKGSAIHATVTRLSRMSRFESRDSEVKRRPDNSRSRQKYPMRNYTLVMVRGWNIYAVDGRAHLISSEVRLNTDFKLPPVAKWARPAPDEEV